MIEQNALGENPSPGQSVPSDNVSSGSSQPAPVQEKLLRQSEVTAIAGHAKQQGYEKAMREIADRQQSYAANTAPTQPQAQPANNQMGGNQLTAEQVRQMIHEQAPQAYAQQLQEQQFSNMTSQLIQKLETGKVDYPNFDTKVSTLNLRGHPELLPLLNTLDQGVAAGVLDDMADNPRKFADLKILNMMNPQLAAVQLNKLAESIRQNKAATQVKSPNEPLGQIKTSVTGADNGSLTVGDLKRDPRYRA
jgi:hypothetical protein